MRYAIRLRPLAGYLAFLGGTTLTSTVMASELVILPNGTLTLSGDHSADSVTMGLGSRLTVLPATHLGSILSQDYGPLYLTVGAGSVIRGDIALAGPQDVSSGQPYSQVSLGEATGDRTQLFGGFTSQRTDATFTRVDVVRNEPDANDLINPVDLRSGTLTFTDSTVTGGRVGIEADPSDPGNKEAPTVVRVNQSQITANAWAGQATFATFDATGSTFSGGLAGLVLSSSSATLRASTLTGTGADSGSRPTDLETDGALRDKAQGGLRSVGVAMQSDDRATGATQVTIDQGSRVSATGQGASAGLYLAGYAQRDVAALVTGGSAVAADGYGVLIGRPTPFTAPLTGTRASANTVPFRAQLDVEDASVAGRLAAVAVTGGQQATVTLGPRARLSADSHDLITVSGVGTSADIRVNGTALDGNLRSDDHAMAKVRLGQGAVLQGLATGTTLAMQMDNGSQWVLPGANTLGPLSMDAGSTVRLAGVNGQTAGVLTVAQLSGQGAFVMAADLAHLTGDTLVVTGQATGQHTIVVPSTGQEGAGKPLTLVRTGGGSATFALPAGSTRIDAGAYTYTLTANGANWQLTPTATVAPAARSVLSLFSVAPTVWYGEVAPVRRRMGDLRDTDESAGGAWVRTYASQQSVDARSGVAFDQWQTGLSLGADARWDIRGGRLYGGLVFNASRSHLRTPDALTASQVHSYSLGGYGSWYSDTGYYLDGVLTLNHFGNALRGTASDRTAVSGNYSNHGWGGQVELGRHMAMGTRSYLEPYLLLSGFWASSKRYGLDNDLQADGRAARSFRQSLGLTWGTRLGQGTNTLSPYVRLAAIHESVRHNAVTINDKQFTTNLAGVSGELAVGLTGQFNGRAAWYAEYAYAKGPKLTTPFSASLGLRVRF